MIDAKRLKVTTETDRVGQWSGWVAEGAPGRSAIRQVILDSIDNKTDGQLLRRILRISRAPARLIRTGRNTPTDPIAATLRLVITYAVADNAIASMGGHRVKVH